MHNTKVLVIENFRDQRMSLKTKLAQIGCRLLVAKSDEAVIEHLSDCSPDILLVDVDTLGSKGAPAIRKAKRMLRRACVPVVVVTERNDEDSVIVGLAAGADDFICGPFTPTDLGEKIVTVLNERSLWDERASGGMALNA